MGGVVRAIVAPSPPPPPPPPPPPAPAPEPVQPQQQTEQRKGQDAARRGSSAQARRASLLGEGQGQKKTLLGE